VRLAGHSAEERPASGIIGLAGLARATLLETVVLRASRCSLDDDVGHTLAFLARLPKLRTLELDLSSNRLTHTGLLQLAHLGRLQSLTDLSLDVSDNALGSGSLEGLVSAFLFRPGPKELVRLSFNVGGTALEDCDLATVGNLGNLPKLQSLSLGLWRNQVGPMTMQSIVWLRFAKCLVNVTLDLHNCGLTGEHIPSLGALCTMERLRLLLHGNDSLDACALVGVLAIVHLPTSKVSWLSLQCDRAAGERLRSAASSDPRTSIVLVN
jgi:hypothetical protein